MILPVVPSPGPESVLGWSIVMATRRDRVLDLDLRRRLFEHVRSYPGLHLRELARGLDLDPNHAKYHLLTLEKHGFVSSRKEDGYWRFYPRKEGSMGMQDAVGAKDKALLALLRRPVPLHVTLLLIERGEASQSELLAEVNVVHSTLHYHLKRMEKADLVASERRGRERVYRLVDPHHVQEQLTRYRPPDALVRGFLEAWEQLELV